MPASTPSTPVSPPATRSTDPLPPAPGPLALFLAFSWMALCGFGGVLPFAYRALVERRRWLTGEEFAELLALGQILPGPNVCNLSLMVGLRFAGLPGAFAALLGMVLLPALIVVALGIAWQFYGELQPVRHALTGMAAVAAGLVIATALKMALQLPRAWRIVVFTTAGFVTIGVLRWPFLAAVGLLAPLSVWIAWRNPDG